MASTTGIIDRDAVDKVENLDQVIRFLPPERIIQVLGVERVLEVINL